MINSEIAKIFYEMADILEMKNVQWKPAAYRKAARVIESLSEGLDKIYKRGGLDELKAIPGIGERLAKKIIEYIKTGKIKEYEKLKKSVPINIEELSRIEGLGPKRIKVLHKKLGIKNLKDLEKAAKKGKIRNLPGFGIKSEEDILKAIEFAKKSRKRKLLSYALSLAFEIVEKLKTLKETDKIEIAGSLRRKKETIGDIDILVTSKNWKKVMDFFTTMPGVVDVVAKGETKSTIVYGDMEVDLRVLEPKRFGSALMYFTGSKDHNIALRKLAIKKGYKLSEYGLFKGNKFIAGRTEKEIYKKLGMDYIEPELRENRGEIKAALNHKLPKLVERKDILGDLQMHTKYSDGGNTIEEMAKKAIELGHKYIAITDHAGILKIAGAMTPKEIEQRKKEIEKLNEKFKNLKILNGAEVDIKLNGDLALPNKILKKFDIVLAAIHTGLKRENTNRLIKAMQNPYVDIIAHPTGRLINEREAYPLNLDKIFDAALKYGKILEINAFPNRLDLNDINARTAKERGILLSIGTDSHEKDQLRYIDYGIYVARRAWCEKKNIINTYPYKKLIKLLQK